jgi:hypothetical protein
VIELLAITDDAGAPDPPLSAVRRDGLSALCAPAGEQQEVTPAALWRREEMLEQLMHERDLLPVRFGTLLADEEAAARALAERRDEFTAGLTRVRGAVELALRVVPREPEPPPTAATGREYLRAKVARMETAQRLHEPLTALARESATQPGRELLRAAYLVDRAAVDEFVAAVQRIQRDHPELALLCTGPWPPYSFVGGGGEE